MVSFTPVSDGFPSGGGFVMVFVIRSLERGTSCQFSPPLNR